MRWDAWPEIRATGIGDSGTLQVQATEIRMAPLDSMRKLWEGGGRRRRITDLFDGDPRRQDRFSLEFEGLLFDYSKVNLDREELRSLVELAGDCELAERIEGMFRGERINVSEDRPALHTALRCSPGESVVVDGLDVAEDARRTLGRMGELARRIRSGPHGPEPGGGFTDVISIGIGGSDLGPAMAVEALAPYADGPEIHFVSNVDGAQIDGLLRRLNPATTMVVVASKTFRTIETLTNARTARDWIGAALGEAGVRERFVGVSSNIRETGSFGVDPGKVLGFGDWVGGRYSVWGPVGFPLMLAVGPDDFRSFLDGAGCMDRHFRTARFDRNMPVLLGLTGILHNQVCGYASRAILPYDQRLARLPAYLQQLEMESNGKSVTLDGRPVREHSAPVIWGEPGTNGQHAFHQMLHQGTRIVPCEFLVAAVGHEPELTHHHDILVANCLAQAQALMKGNDPEGGGANLEFTPGPDAHRTCRGNRPSTMLAYRKLTPFVLGQIIALYEHRVFVEGCILGINSFDQWGVELGKQLATELLDSVAQGKEPAGADGSTRKLLDFVHRERLAERSRGSAPGA